MKNWMRLALVLGLLTLPALADETQKPLVIYTSQSSEVAASQAKAYMAANPGVHVVFCRESASKLIEKLHQEAQEGSVIADLVILSGPGVKQGSLRLPIAYEMPVEAGPATKRAIMVIKSSQNLETAQEYAAFIRDQQQEGKNYKAQVLPARG